jgi:hypothetical protein
MFRGDHGPHPDCAESPRKPCSSATRAESMTKAQGSLRQINLGEIAMNGVFSPAWVTRD